MLLYGLVLTGFHRAIRSMHGAVRVLHVNRINADACAPLLLGNDDVSYCDSSLISAVHEMAWSDSIFTNLIKHLSRALIGREERARGDHRCAHERPIFVEDPRTVDNLIFQNFAHRLQNVGL